MGYSFRNLTVLCLAAVLCACGGGGGSSGGGGGGGGVAGARMVSSGVMTKGSVIVNGVRFDDTNAVVTIDGTPKTAADLQNGMVINLEARVGADGVPTSGRAVRIDAQIQVRGLVTSVDATAVPQSFVILGQEVLVDELTIYSDLVDFSDIAVGDLLEVHGQRDSGERVRATRVEANTLQMGNSAVDQIRGLVSGSTGTNPATFNLSAQAVNAAGAIVTPAGASYQEGTLVEVRCVRPCVVASVFQASGVEVESVEDSGFLPGFNERAQASGFITGYDAPGDTDFFVNGVPVTTTASTRYKGGRETDLENGVRVDANGIYRGVAVVVNDLQFRRSVLRLQGKPSVPVGNNFTLFIGGAGTLIIDIEATDLTEGALPTGAEICIEVRGVRKAVSGQIVTADEITLSCGVSNNPFIQAPVEAKVTDVSVTLIGFVIDISVPTGFPPWLDSDNQSITRSEFFDAVTELALNNAGVPVPGTLVKVTYDKANDPLRASIED